MNERRVEPVGTHDDGFGMLEIMVSMLLLGLLAIGFLPLLMQSARVSASNATLATATQLVSQEMERLRSEDWTCASLSAYAAVDDGVSAFVAQVDGTTGLNCATLTAPTTREVRVWVHERSQTKSISAASTLIYLSSN